MIGTEGPLGDTAGTWQNSFTAGPRTGTTGGTADSNITVAMGWQTVSDAGSYTASKTGMTSGDHASIIATFKAQPSTRPLNHDYRYPAERLQQFARISIRRTSLHCIRNQPDK